MQRRFPGRPAPRPPLVLPLLLLLAGTVPGEKWLYDKDGARSAVWEGRRWRGESRVVGTGGIGHSWIRGRRRGPDGDCGPRQDWKSSGM